MNRSSRTSVKGGARRVFPLPGCEGGLALEGWSGCMSALFPGECLLCGHVPAGPDNLCKECRDAMPVVAAACPVCAEPLPTETRCPRCRATRPHFSRSIAPLLYASEVRHLVLQLKFAARLDAGLALAMLLVKHLGTDGHLRAERLVPVPLHPRRLRTRGFNQAHEIAGVVADMTGIAMLPNVVRRVRFTAAQTGLTSREARTGNLRGAFGLVTHAEVAGRRLAIIDDVITTGATANSLAATLRAAGASDVEVWACARAAGTVS